jgi:hypothetical protein
VPSFSRQTGLQCAVCHSNPPELTAFGRKFKLEGYTLTEHKPGSAIEDKDLKLERVFPLSVMILSSATLVDTRVPGAQAGSVELAQALSLFLAGAISTHVGTMLQVTYSHGSDHFGLDNTDIRYANHTTLGSKDLLFGFTLNNNPTVEDVWNGTPAWGYPWISSGAAPKPGTSPIVEGPLAQDVAGLGAYSLWDDHLYLGFALYRSEHAGGPQALTGTGFPIDIQGVAPYWRLAWQQSFGTNYLEIGTFGIHVAAVPGATGGRDSYTDFGFDLQYERPFGTDLLSAHARWIHETSSLAATLAAGGATALGHRLNSFRADATYHLGGRYTLTLAGFSSNGDTDPLLYPAASVTGSRLGSPESRGYIVQAGYWPAQNIDLSLAYTGYSRFNGGTDDYDGSGRSASANNSVYLALWMNY